MLGVLCEGDSLASRGLVYCAQFCYVAGGEPFARHALTPLAAAPAPPAPPRLSLLLADPHAVTLNQLATNEAIFATEIYEYALSLSHENYVIDELQVYKLVAACRLLDLGQVERALGYVERAARAVTRAPRAHPAALPARLALLADRLKYYDPALHEDPPLVDDMAEGDSGEPSPRHHQQWLEDVKNVANMLEAEARQQTQYSNWHEQTTQYQQSVQTYPKTEETPDYATQYYHHQEQSHYAQQDRQYSQTDGQYVQQDQNQEPQEPGEQHTGLKERDATYTYGEEWPQDQAQNYADPYWQNDSHYGYGESRRGAGLRRRANKHHDHDRDHHRDDHDHDHRDYHNHRDDHRDHNVRTLLAPAHRAIASLAAPSTKLSDLDVQTASSKMFHSSTPRTPRPQCGSLISGSVDAWSRKTMDRPFKPLVFGGTYPIDEPASPQNERGEICRSAGEEVDLATRSARSAREEVLVACPGTVPWSSEQRRQELRKTVQRSLQRFDAALARTTRKKQTCTISRTFDIDEPVQPDHIPPEARLTDDHAAYYVSGPKTFDIDEPVSFI